VKILKIAAIVVGVVAFAASVVVTAGATLGIAASVIAAAGTVASIATVASIGIGLVSLAVGAGSKPPPVGGNQTDFKADPQAGVPYAMGRTAYAGNVVARDTYGSNNEIQGIVTVLSGGGPIDSIESFSVDNAATTFGTGGNAVGEFHDFMWLHSQLGACPEASALTASQGTLPGWGSTSKLSGLAAFLWELKFDKKGKHYAGGLPSPLTVLKGVKVYDPRLDSTYPGGSGSCRALVESTYVWSENPWLHALTFALGRFQNGKRVIGCGMPVASIDVGAFVEAANVADANGWTTGGVVFSTDDKWGVLKALAQAGGGEVMQLSARLSCLVNTPRVSLATITRDDIVGRASVTGTQARRDRINGVTPRIRSEGHGWEVVPLDIVRGDTYLDEDGAERTREIDYQLVQDGDQAAKLAAYDIANAREFGPITLPLKPVWMGYKPGDCLTVNDPELGLTSQPCINLTRDLELASGVCTLTLRSETTAKHAWALGQTATAPPTPGLSAPDFTVAAPVEDSWTLEAIALAGTSGESVPVLRVTGAVDNPNAEAVQFEYRLDGDTDWHFAGLGGPDAAAFDIGSIIPGADYEVAVSYEVRGVKGDRLILGPVTATALSVVGADGISSAQVFIYQRSATAPTLPSATTTYTFATGGLTGLNNGWTRTIPAGSNPLYVSLATAAGTDPTDDIAAGEWATPIVLAQDGSGGVNSATIFLYQRNSTGVAPSVPSATVTYTFATAGLSGVNNGWSATVPDASGGTFLWVTTASALGTGATDTIATGEWATVRVMAQDGATGSTGTAGANGQNTAAVYLYQRAASSPSLPSGILTYTFATGALSGTLGSWSQGVPATNGQPLWVTVATATGTGATDTIANTEWASPVTMVQDGVNSASIFLYQRNSTGIAPSTPSVLTTYTFATGVLASINNGWSQSVPDISNGTYLWVTTATALSTTATDTISTVEWATPQVMAQNGATGPAGANAAIVYLYQRASSAPSTPSGTTTFTFASGALSGTITPWSQTVPADNGLPLYVTTASASGNGTTDTIAAGEWASPVVLTSTGTNGLNTATIYLFQRGTSAPAVPSTTTTYTFATAVLSGTLAGWTQTIPSGTDPIYVTTATALSTGATDTIANTEWATPNVLAQNGLDGTYAWTPVLTNIRQTGATFTPTASDGANNGTFPCMGYSAEKQIGMGIGAVQVTPTTNNYVIGLDAAPSGVTNYNGIDFAVVPGSGNINIYTNGTSVGVVGTFTASDVLAVEHRGTTVVALKNGATVYTWTGVSATTPLGACFGFDSGGSMQLAVYKTGLDGAAGANGANAATVFLFQRATSTPSVPASTLTYTFASGGAFGHAWKLDAVGAVGTDPLYVTSASASGTGATDTIATGEWATPVIFAQNGAAGTPAPPGSTAPPSICSSAGPRRRRCRAAR
jgi:hypothetical protein